MLFQVVKQQVDSFDEYGLLEGGAPKNEFDKETAMITARLRKGMTADSIAEIMAEVFNKQFNKNYVVVEFITYAEQIEKFLNNT